MKILTLMMLLSLNAFAHTFEEASNIDPFNGEEFQQVRTSEVFRNTRFRNNYFYRYVTLYNIETRQNEMQQVPRFKEECFEEGDRFAVWIFEEEYSRTKVNSFGFALLGIDIGLGADFGRTFVFAFERWIQAVAGIEAVHIPMMEYQVYQGFTYQETYFPKTGETRVSRINNENFFVDYINPMFVAKREIISTCQNYQY